MAAHLGPGLPPAEALTELLRLTAQLGIRLQDSQHREMGTLNRNG